MLDSLLADEEETTEMFYDRRTLKILSTEYMCNDEFLGKNAKEGYPYIESESCNLSGT